MGLGALFCKRVNKPGQGLADIRPKEQSGVMRPRQLPSIRTPARPQLFPAARVGTKEGRLQKTGSGAASLPFP